MIKETKMRMGIIEIKKDIIAIIITIIIKKIRGMTIDIEIKIKTEIKKIETIITIIVNQTETMMKVKARDTAKKTTTIIMKKEETDKMEKIKIEDIIKQKSINRKSQIRWTRNKINRFKTRQLKNK